MSTGRCKDKCTEGNPCALSNNKHVMHICANTDCPCHSKDRYAKEKELDDMLKKFERGKV